MSNSVRALVVVAAISLGVVASQIRPGGAESKPDQDTTRSGNEAGKPQVESRAPFARRSIDLPLQHAILRDEKEDDSPEARIIKQLDKPTTVEFLDLPLEDCLAFLKEYHKINIWLDMASLADEGVALDQPITLKLAGVRFESVLHLLLESVQLDWLIQDEVLKITTKSWANRHPETRTYDVHNLIKAGHTHEELIASITKCIEPHSWAGKDATAGIAHTGGVLVVRQSQRAHSEITHLLEELDAIADEKDGGHAVKEAGSAARSVSVRRVF